MSPETRKNKGEWSELYAVVKTLVDWALHPADENLNVIRGKDTPVKKVTTGKSPEEHVYELDEDGRTIVATSGDRHAHVRVERSFLREHVDDFLREIRDARGRSFESATGVSLMRQLGLTDTNASGQEKADVLIVIHDLLTGTEPELGFSIKSQLGSPSTLLNPSGATNFEFAVAGPHPSAAAINASTGPRARVQAIYAGGGRLRLAATVDQRFRENLMYVDSLMPEILGEVLTVFYRGLDTNTLDICRRLDAEKPLTRTDPSFAPGPGFYRLKMGQLLVAVALGMVPTRQWNGQMLALGGYLVVRGDGEVVCYHLYNLDQFRGYLLAHTKLDTPSTTRYGYGSVYDASGGLAIRLNLQIRFTE